MGAEARNSSASGAADAMQFMAMAGWKTGDMLNGISGYHESGSRIFSEPGDYIPIS